MILPANQNGRFMESTAQETLRRDRIMVIVAVAAVVSSVGLALGLVARNDAKSVAERKRSAETRGAQDSGYRQRLHKGIESSADYLVRMSHDDGMFVYRINLDPNVTVKTRYNLLRHAGAIYALAMHYQRTPREDVRPVLDGAARWLMRVAVKPLADRPDLLAVWSDPKVIGKRRHLQAKLGGTGLSLAALSSVERLFCDTVPLKVLQRMGQFILFMQKPDGSFHSKYIPSQGGRNDKWTSLYYPGEQRGQRVDGDQRMPRSGALGRPEL